VVRVMWLVPGQGPELKEVEDDLDAYRELVGGPIDVRSMGAEIAGEMGKSLLMVCDDEGLRKWERGEVSPNFVWGYGAVVGPVFFVGRRGSEFQSITAGQAAAVERWLAGRRPDA
jgi:hypothetical protein